MQRYKIILEYDGSAFHGWQQQVPGLLTVQSRLQAAILGLTGELVMVWGAGRTDAGVHAIGQVAHFDLKVKPVVKLGNFLESLNYFLRPQPIVITQLEEAGPRFHARFSARERRYIYRILNREASPILQKGRVWHIRDSLDWQAMHDAAQVLVGYHDFTSFCATFCQSRSKIKTLSAIEVSKSEEDAIVSIKLRAPSFLHNQVRIIVGTLHRIGVGKLDRLGLEGILASRDRKNSGRTAPAQGLCFVEAVY